MRVAIELARPRMPQRGYGGRGGDGCHSDRRRSLHCVPSGRPIGSPQLSWLTQPKTSAMATGARLRPRRLGRAAGLQGDADKCAARPDEDGAREPEQTGSAACGGRDVAADSNHVSAVDSVAKQQERAYEASSRESQAPPKHAQPIKSGHIRPVVAAETSARTGGPAPVRRVFK